MLAPTNVSIARKEIDECLQQDTYPAKVVLKAAGGVHFDPELGLPLRIAEL